jgi:hypothetical protein
MIKIAILITVSGVSYCLFFHIRVEVHVTYFKISENLKTYINIIICNTVKHVPNLQKLATP